MAGMFQDVYQVPQVKTDVNVGQFGWTEDDEKNMTQINSYLAEIIRIANEMSVKYSEVKAIATSLDATKTAAEDLANHVTDLTKQFDEKYADFLQKYGHIPRQFSFCSFNDLGYESGITLAYYVTDVAFTFQKDFAGSKATYKLLKEYPQLPAAALVDIWVTDADGSNATKLGTVQMNPDHTFIFQSSHDTYHVEAGRVVEFRVGTLDGVNSLSISLVFGD